MAAWNAARRSCEPTYGPIPQAHEVCRQLADRDGNPFSWRELRALVFDDTRDIKKTHEERLSEQDRPVTDKHVYWALNRIANVLRKKTLVQHEYEEKREEMLRAASGTRLGATLRLQLPTRGQIENACGRSWDRALEIARLDPRRRVGNPAKRMPLVEAMLLFYQGHAYLPTEAELVEAAKRQGIALERDRRRSWPDYVEKAREIASARGFREPPPYGASIGSNEGDNTRRRGGKYPRVEVVAWVREFAATLPAHTPATNKRWKAFQRGRSGIPSLNVLIRHGGLAALLKEATHPDWERRAELWDASERKPRRRRGRPKSPKRQQLLSAIEARVEASAGALADQLEWPLETVRYYLRVLKRAGEVAAVKKHPQAKDQTYRLAKPAGN